MAEQTMNVRLIHGDCLVEMGQIGDGSIDLIAADLPYGTTNCRWDTVIPFEPLWSHYKRIIKPRGAIVLTASQPFTSALVMSNPKWFRYEWVWDKKLPNGFLDANRKPLRRHEAIVVFCETRTTYNPVMRTGKMRNKGCVGKKSNCYGDFQHLVNRNDQYFPTSIIEFANAGQGEKLHPTQKPVALMEYLIRTYTNEGETVLDNTMGSGTTGVACANTGRDFIGIEQSEDYFKVAQDRVAAAQAEREGMLIPA